MHRVYSSLSAFKLGFLGQRNEGKVAVIAPKL
jgi:hypothetical protein